MPRACPVDRYVPRYSANAALRKCHGLPVDRAFPRYSAPRSGNATGLPRGSLRSSLQRKATPRALGKCHEPAPWIVTFLATARTPRASGNATGLPRGSLRSSLQRKRRVSGNATGLPRGSLRSSLQRNAEPREMPRARPVDHFDPRYSANAASQGNATPEPAPWIITFPATAQTPRLRKCHGPAPWIVTFLATARLAASQEMPRACPWIVTIFATARTPRSGNATGRTVDRYDPRYGGKRRVSGNATGLPRGSFLATAQKRRAWEMPRACPVDHYDPRYSAGAASRKCHGPARGSLRSSLLPSATPRLRKCHGPAPWIVV